MTKGYAMAKRDGSLSSGASRREFLRISAMGAVAGSTGITATPTSGMNLPPEGDTKGSPSTAATMIGVPYTQITSPQGPRIGLIGVGGRGTSLLKNLLGASASVLAICDVVEEKATQAQSLVEKGRPEGAQHFTPRATMPSSPSSLVTILTWSSSPRRGTGMSRWRLPA